MGIFQTKKKKKKKNEWKKMEDEFDKHAQLIIDGLYLGSEDAGQVDLELLEKRKITRIGIPAFTGIEKKFKNKIQF